MSFLLFWGNDMFILNMTKDVLKKLVEALRFIICTFNNILSGNRNQGERLMPFKNRKCFLFLFLRIIFVTVLQRLSEVHKSG